MELQGKIINFLGDSITEGVGVMDRENNRFDHVLERTCGLKATYNYGIGGTRLAHQKTPSEKPRHDLCFCGRAYDLNPEADIIIVYGGTNDYGHGDAPFGEYGDQTPDTYCGAVYWLMNFLKNQYPNAKVVFITPARRVSDLERSARKNKLPCAKPLLAYGEVIQRQAKDFDIPVLDFYHDLGINPNNEAERVKYTTDGLHFNDEGHAVLAQKIAEFLKSL